MNLLWRVLTTLWRELTAVVQSLRSWYAVILLGGAGVLLWGAVALPLSYRVDVGCEEGYGSDLPLVSGFFPPEPDACGVWRWTRERAEIHLPGLGQRPVEIALTTMAVNEEVARLGPQTFTIWHDSRALATFPVRPTGAIYRFRVPATASGNQGFAISSATFVPTGDERSIGLPVTSVQVSAAGGLVLPAPQSSLLWLVALVLAWIAVRQAGFAPRIAFRLLLPALLLLGLAAWRDPPRLAFGAGPAVIALGIGLLLVLVLRRALPWLATRLEIALDDRALRWLLLLALVVFATRYGGKIYPDSMWGDIGFHANRFSDMVRGTVLILSRNRGVDFPYPPAFYLLLAPFTLLGLDRSAALQLSGALLDAISPLLVYTIAVCSRPRAAEPRVAGWPLVAAGIYSLSASGYMTTWWNFSTHIFTQFAHLLLITTLIVLWPRVSTPQHRTNRRLLLAILLLTQAFVYLGHFGFWMNMSLLGAMSLLVLGIWTWRRKTSWTTFRLLLVAFVAAEFLAVLFFYSAYTGLFVEQLQAAANGGLTGLAGRGPASMQVLWDTLWNAGFRIHFGLFPVLLALAGLVLACSAGLASTPSIIDRPRVSTRAVCLTLMSGTFLIALGFAALPFVSGSTLSTRWLMFAAWVIAVAGSWGASWLWRRGWAGRLLVGAMGGYMLWITAAQWLGALAFRIRPPEPF